MYSNARLDDLSEETREIVIALYEGARPVFEELTEDERQPYFRAEAQDLVVVRLVGLLGAQDYWQMTRRGVLLFEPGRLSLLDRVAELFRRTARWIVSL